MHGFRLGVRFLVGVGFLSAIAMTLLLHCNKSRRLQRFASYGCSEPSKEVLADIPASLLDAYRPCSSDDAASYSFAEPTRSIAITSRNEGGR